MKKILVVDDSESDHFYNEIILRGRYETIKIIQAYDGQEALERLSEHKEELPDLILLDINMPRMNGHDFLKEYSPRGDREIPIVVMLTSSDQDQDKSLTMGYKCVKDYMVKPIDAGKLDKLETLLASL